MFKIVDEHTNNKGLWIKNPEQTIIYNKVKVSLTIRELIEVYCKKGFSKMLRKTFTHKCQKALEGRSDLSKRHTRHKTQQLLEGDYDGAPPSETRETAVKIAQILPMIKLRA